jgi:hypothetical protein
MGALDRRPSRARAVETHRVFSRIGYAVGINILAAFCILSLEV